MARKKLPDFPANATPKQVVEAIDANLTAGMAETTARNYVIRCLGALGNRRNPQVKVGQIEGSRVRLYIWDPVDALGEGVVLAAGYSFQPKFALLSQLAGKPAAGAYYIEAQPDRTSAAKKAKGYTGVIADRRATKAAAAVVAAEKKPTRARTTASGRGRRRTPAPAPAAPPPAPPAARGHADAEAAARAKLGGMSKAERGDLLQSSLAALLG